MGLYHDSHLQLHVDVIQYGTQEHLLQYISDATLKSRGALIANRWQTGSINNECPA